MATRWDITQLKNYERELVAAKEELEKALKKQKLALKVSTSALSILIKITGYNGRKQDK